jgi:hypothetical protein
VGVIAGSRPGLHDGPTRIVWVSYLRPEGFDVDTYGDQDTLVDHLASGQEAADWAAKNKGVRLSVVVILVAYMPGLDYDPAAILQTLRDSCRMPRFVISIRENGPLFRLSHHAFTAEFREICGHGTLVLEEDSSLSRSAGPGAARKPDAGRPGGKPGGGVSIESRWDEIARRAVALTRGTARIDSPAPAEDADEALRLVRAMRAPGARNRPGTFARIHKRMMVALGLPGASMRSADIATLLRYAQRDIMNSYGNIAFVVRDHGDDPDERAQGASDFCKRLGRDYQDWLISFGIRHQLLPPNYRLAATGETPAENAGDTTAASAGLLPVRIAGASPARFRRSAALRLEWMSRTTGMGEDHGARSQQDRGYRPPQPAARGAGPEPASGAALRQP